MEVQVMQTSARFLLTVAIAGLLVIGCGGGSQPTTPYDEIPATILKIVEMPGTGMDILLNGGYAYVPDASSTLKVIDVDPPASAHIASTIELPWGVNDVAVSGSYAYVAGDGLEIINIDSPESAYSVSACDIPGTANCVAVSGGYAYTTGEPGLYIFDIDPPESASVVCSVVGTEDTLSLEVSGGYAYLGGKEFQIIDIDPPESANIVTTINPSGSYDFYGHIAVSDGYAYAVEKSNFDYRHTIDIDPPESAYIVGSFRLYGIVTDVAVSGGYLYALDFYGFSVYNINPPDDPQVVGYVPVLSLDPPRDPQWFEPPSFYLNCVAVSGEYVYVTGYNTDFLIAKVKI
jgi:hypothetical protein